MSPRLSRTVALLAALAFAGPVEAKDLFNLEITVNSNGQQGAANVAFSSVTDLVNALKSENLSSLVGIYNDNSTANAVVNLRGVQALAGFFQNSPVLYFKVPAAGIDVTFNGATRNESEQLFRDFLTKNGGGLTTRLLQLLASSSPVDPVAGNPTSLQFSSARVSFSSGTGIGVSGYEIPGGSANQAGLLGQPNLFGAGGDIGVATSGGYQTFIATLPIRYTIPFGDPRWALIFDVPITYLETGAASSFAGSFGVGLRIPILDNWYITPGASAGAAGSIQLGAVAVEYAQSLASRYSIYLGDVQLTLGNGFTLSEVGGISIGSVNVSYNMTNQLITNGLQAEASLPFTLFGNPTSWQAYVVDTAVTGSKVYVSHYDEIGFTVGSRHGLNGQDWSALRVGAGVTFGEHYNAFKLGFTYRF